MTGFDVELAVEHLLLSLRHGHVVLLGQAVLSDRLQLTIHALHEQIVRLLDVLDVCGAGPRHVRLVIPACSQRQHLSSFLATKGEVTLSRLPNVSLRRVHQQVLVTASSGANLAFELAFRVHEYVPRQLGACTISIGLLQARLDVLADLRVKDRRGILVSLLEADHLGHFVVIEDRVLLTDGILAAERLALDRRLLLKISGGICLVSQRLCRSSCRLRGHAAAEDLPPELVSFRVRLHD